MSFRCPQCQTPNSLEIDCSIELPPDRETEEISLQVVACGICIYQGVAVYAEARGSCPEAESWRHVGFWVSPDAVESVRKAIQACPDPHNRGCECDSHTALGQKDLHGRWKGLLELERGHTFLMRMYLG
jgi:hypothetical protein